MDKAARTRPNQTVPSGEQPHGEVPMVTGEPEQVLAEDGNSGATSVTEEEKTGRRPGDGYQPL